MIDVDAEIVFVGDGVDAPEYGWNDYKNVDVKGKVLVMLVNDSAVADPNDSTKLDSTMFKGKAMTYYGRWTYKWEIATAKCAAVLADVIRPAAWSRPIRNWRRASFTAQIISNLPSRACRRCTPKPACDSWARTPRTV